MTLASRDARHMTLGMTGVWDVMRKLEWELSNFEAEASEKIPGDERNRLRHVMYAATNAASTSWSLVEWLYYEVHDDPERLRALFAVANEPAKTDLGTLKHSLRREVPVIDACFGIAHAAKHRRLDRMPEHVRTPLSYHFWVSKPGEIFLSLDGSVFYGPKGTNVRSVGEFVTEVAGWWRNTLSKLDIPDPPTL